MCAVVQEHNGPRDLHFLQMSFFIDQGHDTVFSQSYNTARATLTSKMEVEAANILSKSRLE